MSQKRFRPLSPSLVKNAFAYKHKLCPAPAPPRNGKNFTPESGLVAFSNQFPGKPFFPSRFAPPEHRALIYKTDRVAQRIFRIETPLAPRLRFDPAVDFGTAQFFCPRERPHQILYCKINMIRIRPRVEAVAIRSRIEAGDNHSPTIEIVPPRLTR